MRVIKRGIEVFNEQLEEQQKKLLKHTKNSASLRRLSKAFGKTSGLTDKKGNLTHPSILRGIDPECDEAALYAISKLKTWSPGLVRKKPVLVRFNLPVKFKLK